jgi:hypothetical protein
MYTKDINFLKASFNEFNGSGYADRTGPNLMVESYIDYSNWRGRFENAQLAMLHLDELVEQAKHLLATSNPERTVSKKFMDKFNEFREAPNV